jgi:molybdenum cofactor guanylyltransferase
MDSIVPGVTAFILAGGKSTRMGADTAFLTLGGLMLDGPKLDGSMLDGPMRHGPTLLARALELAHSVTGDARIVGDTTKFAAYAPVVEDVFRNCGPLGGIHAALRVSPANLNVILAVDVPFVSPALLQYLIMSAKASGACATVPRTNGRWQPLCAVYRRKFADAAEEALREGRYKIDALFATQQTQTIEENELKAAGFSPNMFQNLNTPEDLEAVGDNNLRDAFRDSKS